MSVLPVECVEILNIWPSRLPFVNCFSRLAGYLRVREMPFDQFIEAGSRLLADGVSIIAFPEGTRSGSCNLGQFHGSAFRLAQHAGAKICPLTISGNENIPPRGSLVLHPGRIVISKLPAVTCEQYKEMNAYRLKTRVPKPSGSISMRKPSKRLSQNLMSQRRHYFGPASRSDDESYSNGYGEEERRRGRPKKVSPSVARKRPVCGVVGPQRIPANTLRPSALHPGLFLAIAGSLGFEIVSKYSMDND